MAAYSTLSPGVYVSWIDAGVSPAGISTSIGGMAFHANRGSLNPTSQTSYDTFTKEYGVIDYTQSYGGDTAKGFFRTAQAAVCVRSPGSGAQYAGWQLANNYLLTQDSINAPNGLVYDGSYVMPLRGTNVDYTQQNQDSWDLLFSEQVPSGAVVSFNIQGITSDQGGVAVAVTNTYTNHYLFLKALAAAITTALQTATTASPLGAFAQVVPRNGFDYVDMTNEASVPMTIRMLGPQNIELSIASLTIASADGLSIVARETEWLAYGIAENPGKWANNVACQFTKLNTNRAASVQLMAAGKLTPLSSFTYTINGVTETVPANANGNNAMLTDIAASIMANVPNITASVVQVQGVDNNRQITLTANSALYNNAVFNIVVSMAQSVSVTPGIATGTPSVSGGTLAADTYYVRIAAVDAAGNVTNLGPESSATVTGSTGSIAYAWTAITGAASYRIYFGTTASGENAYFTSSSNSFTLIATTGSTTAATLPAAVNPPSINVTTLISPYIAPTDFVMNIYEYPNLTNIQVSLSSTLQTILSATGAQTNFAYQVNAGPQSSGYLRVYVNPLAVSNNWTVQGTTSVNVATGSGFMGGGVDGELSTSADIIDAWTLLSDPTQWTVRILMNCGYATVPVQQFMAELCEARRDCFAILDMDAAAQQNDTSTITARNGMNINTMYAAVYTPDIVIYDTDLNITRYSPPSGYVGAVYALTDAARAVWWSPAGLNRGMIPEAQDLRFAYDDGMVSNMAAFQINPIINYKNEMIVVWGDWTLYFASSPLQYVGTARMCIIIELEAKETVAFSLFEPNNQLTRNAVVNNLNQICTEIENGEGLNNFAVVDLTQPYHVDARQAYFRIILDPTTSIHQIVIDGIITKNGASFAQYESINYLTTAGGGTNISVSTVG